MKNKLTYPIHTKCSSNLLNDFCNLKICSRVNRRQMCYLFLTHCVPVSYLRVLAQLLARSQVLTLNHLYDARDRCVTTKSPSNKPLSTATMSPKVSPKVTSTGIGVTHLPPKSTPRATTGNTPKGAVAPHLWETYNLILPKEG
ncbi:hypothetical protein Glo7428_0783 [Gloeocapsa sp. PCC 7428]|nr:hypothetical protein Glo7428_0783 [Gloeocapsa sp. PCC 7428]